ncbi:ABC transporter substrate-binding protein [Variovorax sp. KK3]|uniref:ABC transporter substrate-binding protein n=1 Tax=Variovorax sp. KK3 TaxID=1855728 RepID=UPI00097C273D|nr:ABC transporter substrate-binding protein [Variovorax sp. KK3]
MKLNQAAACGAIALGAICALGTFATTAHAQEAVRIGFITDMSSAYADGDGKDGAIAVQMAIDDFGGKLLGRPMELLSVDHQNKPDIAAAKAREWFDTRNLKMLVGGSNSGAGLAMASVAAEKKFPFFANGAGTSALTNERCTPYTVHYAYDTVAQARGIGSAIADQGGKSWFFLSADYAFGAALEADATRVIQEKGGTVVGVSRHPINAPDFSSNLLQAQNSKAQVLGIANAGGDFINAMKAAREFGVTKSMKVAGFIVFPTDIKSLGLKNTEGLLLVTSWYWDLDEESRAFANRFMAKAKRMPTELHAANYSATMTYLKAATAVNSLDADVVMKHLKSTPQKDFFAKGYIRPDGRYIHDMYLMQVKAPAESKREWDYYKHVATLPGEQVFQSKELSRCGMWK